MMALHQGDGLWCRLGNDRPIAFGVQVAREGIDIDLVIFNS